MRSWDCKFLNPGWRDWEVTHCNHSVTGSDGQRKLSIRNLQKYHEMLPENFRRLFLKVCS